MEIIECFAGKNGSALLLMLPQDFSNRVLEWSSQMINPDNLSGLPNKGYDKSPHITLATGIIDEAPEKAFKLLEKQGPFTVNLGAVDKFPKLEKGYDVLKINVESPILHDLNSGILNNLEVNDPIKPFNPHITLAYVKPFSCDEILGLDHFEGMEIPIDAYVYSDRQKGGKMVRLKKGKPLKESLDYSLQDIAQFLNKKDPFIRAMSALDIARTIISIQYSNKSV